MKMWHLTGALAVCLLVTAGCRTPKGLDELERELFYQEDMIYELKDYLDTYKTQLNECRVENAKLRSKVGADDLPSGPARGIPSRLRPPTIELPSGDEVRPPQVDLPDLSVRPDASDSDEVRASRLTPIADHSHRDLQLVGHVEREVVEDTQIAQIDLNPSGTVGYDATEGSGREGLALLLEARNREGQIVPARGRISIAVVDPTRATIQQGRIARWHISPEEVAEATGDQGTRLRLPWPQGVPKQRRLRLYARLMTDEGQRLVTDHELHIDRDLVGDRPPAPEGFLEQPRRPARETDLVDRHDRHQHPTASPSASDWRTKMREPAPVVKRPDPIETIIVPAEPTASESNAPAVIEHPGAQPARPIREARKRPEWSPYR